MNNEDVLEARQLVAKIGAVLLQRNLTDLAGGNISMRVKDKIVMSPSLAGTNRFWELAPQEVLVLDLEGNKLEGVGEISREAPTHLTLLNHFYPDGRAVIHAHPRNSLVFCAAQRVIPPVMEAVLEFGEIKLVEYANGGIYSEELAKNVLAGLIGQEEMIAKYAAVVMAPWHGVFGVGKSLYTVLDTIDRIENNAYIVLMSKLLLSETEGLEDHRQALIKAVKATGQKSGE